MSSTPISDFGEFALINFLSKNVELHQASTILGIGDDAAVIEHYGNQTVISTDMLVEGVHFDMTYTPLKHLGYKAVVVNLSDICAMNAHPTHVTVSLAISSKYTVEALGELYEGIYLACNHYKVDLVGGDTTSSTQGLVISVTAVGEVVPNQFVQRLGAKENHLICVTGNLGGAFVGLMLLEREKKIFQEQPGIQPQLQQDSYVIERLLKPEARTDIVDWMQQEKIVPSAMIDISDGLSSDILHLCKSSSVGCLLYEEKLPIAEQTKKSAYQFTVDPTTSALNGGEDYELLFTIDASYHAQLEKRSDISIIGYIVDAKEEYKLQSKSQNVYPLKAQGWNALRD